MPLHSLASLGFKIPLMFADGTPIYEQFAKQYITHKKGFFVMAPSGSGKTWFIEHQKEKHWMDGDSLWETCNAHPKGEWWLEPVEKINEIDQRSDVITVQAKNLGFWILGASNWWLQPDAIVLPNWNTHQRWIRERERDHYDGGAKSDRLGQVLNHRRWIKKWAKKGVPEFKTVKEAADYLASTVA